MSMPKQEKYLNDWIKQDESAEAMLPLIGHLYRDRGVNVNVYGQSLVNKTVIDLMSAHKFAQKVLGSELTVVDTYPVLLAMSKLDLSPSRVDIGKLAVQYQEQKDQLSIDEFVAQKLATVNNGRGSLLNEPRDVVLYGFGRIGRLLARVLVEKTGGGDKLRLRAIVVRKGTDEDLMKRASLLERDSVHGPFNGVLSFDEEENAIIANGNMIRLIYANSPDSIDYTAYGINDAIIIDNTGLWRDREGLGQHLKSKGASKVILTAPGKGDIPNIVFGINNDLVNEDETIFSAASCTTNAVVPVLKAVNDKFGIVNGHLETCHSYTNDQNLIDNYHKKSRRGRAAALNMVITETGAAKASAKALPELAGKLTGNAIRVPVANVSMAVLNLSLGKETTVDELNNYLRELALHSPLQNQIAFVNSPELVSSDFIGSRHAGVVDSLATIVNGDRCVLYVWYDNEFGYTCQVVRLLQKIAGIELPVMPN
ncbi:glyceraldehyde-3-phosphate dehydrogenase, type I [Syntrophotalea carbinolica DSM 2380]|uniref:Glyceraldehyde-3-phosphate dehydrogenase, type I n=1 Tax=Syntrophotalea carbinolica (strain DSM 2380 / NBRC 103641 / GraBd1) TaxID=338963 RepID=Q3A2B4_SYNC1|nr:glyceraldehyde-3-phosphate dehydrogenase [Syntrophotalea carbinolica]ABA89493.1 glyceraldehyde-3-phosphate dehydrogenase, type I [Syntrophotalea carbinolica DSM 2380]